MRTRFSIRFSAWAGSLILGVSALSNVALSAARDPNTGASVSATPSTVTLSRVGLPIEAGYLAVLKNDATSNLNFVTFTGTTDVRDNGEIAEIQSVINLNSETHTCLPIVNDSTAGTSSVTCSIATLLPGHSMALVVVAKSPTAGSYIDLKWTLGGSEGNSSNGCCASTGTESTQLTDAVTNESAKTHVQSFLRPVSSGVSLFTGSSGVATSSDRWATHVTVPDFGATLLPYTTADVTESLYANGSSCSAVNLSCNQSKLTIPSLLLVNDNLSITLQQHPSIIKSGSKVADWRIAYAKHGIDFTEILQCSGTGTPSEGKPCIDACKEYTRKSDPDKPTMWGVFECKINAKDNGSYRPL